MSRLTSTASSKKIKNQKEVRPCRQPRCTHSPTPPTATRTRVPLPPSTRQLNNHTLCSQLVHNMVINNEVGIMSRSKAIIRTPLDN